MDRLDEGIRMEQPPASQMASDEIAENIIINNEPVYYQNQREQLLIDGSTSNLLDEIMVIQALQS